jgi:hypothetical protein
MGYENIHTSYPCQKIRTHIQIFIQIVSPQIHFLTLSSGMQSGELLHWHPLSPSAGGSHNKSIDGCIPHDQCIASRTGRGGILPDICTYSSRREDSEYVNETDMCVVRKKTNDSVKIQWNLGLTASTPYCGILGQFACTGMLTDCFGETFLSACSCRMTIQLDFLILPSCIFPLIFPALRLI